MNKKEQIIIIYDQKRKFTFILYYPKLLPSPTFYPIVHVDILQVCFSHLFFYSVNGFSITKSIEFLGCAGVVTLNLMLITESSEEVDSICFFHLVKDFEDHLYRCKEKKNGVDEGSHYDHFHHILMNCFSHDLVCLSYFDGEFSPCCSFPACTHFLYRNFPHLFQECRTILLTFVFSSIPFGHTNYWKSRYHYCYHLCLCFFDCETTFQVLFRADRFLIVQWPDYD